MAVHVDIDNFVRAETAFQFDRVIATTGKVNQWGFLRAPVPIDRQTVIRMQRDTLYGSAVVDISDGAELVLPDTGDRYLSVQVINEDHYTNAVLHDPGTHALTMDEYDTQYVYLIMRILVNPQDPEDLGAVHRLQDATALSAASAEPYTHPAYDEESYEKLYANVLALAEAKPNAVRSFGARDDVDPVRHMIDTAAGWGGLPEYEAFYMGDATPRAAGRYRLSLYDVPADAFWSLSIYNSDGYFQENSFDSYNLNSVVAVPNHDGSVTLNLAPDRGDLVNYLYVMDGWNYVFRLYQPHSEVIDGTWQLPEFSPLEAD